MPGLVTALRAPKHLLPDLDNSSDAEKQDRGYPWGAALREGSESWGAEEAGRGPGTTWCIDPFGQHPPRSPTAALPAPCSPQPQGPRAQPLSTVGGAESREQREGRGGQLLRAPPPPCSCSSTLPASRSHVPRKGRGGG